MKKEYKAPDSRVIVMKATSPLLVESQMGQDGDLRVTIFGFEGSFGEDDVDEGN